MAARHWTQEQRARQAQLIHRWQPWRQSTGARTTEGKAASSQNAVRYSLREIMRESARVNKELISHLKGGLPPNYDRTRIDALITAMTVVLKT